MKLKFLVLCLLPLHQALAGFTLREWTEEKPSVSFECDRPLPMIQVPPLRCRDSEGVLFFADWEPVLSKFQTIRRNELAKLRQHAEKGRWFCADLYKEDPNDPEYPQERFVTKFRKYKKC